MASILLIEDDAALAYALSKSLAQAGHDVKTALDGMSALQMLEADGPIDLVLTDLIMPTGHPHGLALARMARQKRPHLPIIFMTGHVELLNLADGDQILLKPVSVSLMLDEIAETLRKTRDREEARSAPYS
jgi:two-component system, cell cycle sensor histidine kinase and response regulator CckA